jgi:glutamate-ammonia-ligase adenylyltransferase
MKSPIELPKELKDDAQRKWEAFLDAAAAAGVKPPHDPQTLSSIQRVFALSDFVAEGCTREPSILNVLIRGKELQRSYSQTDYASALANALQGVAGEAELGRVLRQFRRRAMIRIAWRDLEGRADLSETVAGLSALADTCLEHALNFLYQWQCSMWGTPAAENGSPQKLVILGLGKLGARELNFSSDVDLVFAYPQSGATRDAEKTLSNEEFFTRLCRRLISVIGKPDAEGIVFRVDLRLRPYGENGPVIMNFQAMENYYQEQGREWERYALIKARVIAGDKAAGAGLLERLHPFIYRRYLDYSAFESLRDMKQMISLEVSRKGMKNNIKLGPGGIREIEFFGQIFQLIRGGVSPALQNRSIQPVLKTLAAQKYISADVCNELTAAYEFLRNTEHRLQEFSDQQTHELPTTYIGNLRLAAAMGMDDPQSFQRALEKHRSNVHQHFQMLLETEESEGRDKEIEHQLNGIWQKPANDRQTAETLSSVGFDQPQEVLDLLDYLRNHLETRELSQTGRQRLDKLIPKVLQETGLSKHPLVTLQRLVDLIKTIERRTSYLALLIENPTVLSHVVRLSEASPWLTSFLARHPVLLDELLDPRTLYTPPGRAEMTTDLDQRMQRVPPEDLEYQIEELCIFKQVNVLRVASADVTGTLPLMRVSDYLSDIAETTLNAVVELAFRHVVARHGEPSCVLEGTACDRGFAVIAYGKLGGLELGYGSDLDLVFLHSGTADQTRGGERPIDSAQFFNRLGQRVVHLLTSHTRAGKVYELDMRLRPSGSSGILVSHIDGFEEYQKKDAWTWEHQAMIKARPICGEKVICDRFKTIREEVLGRPRDKAKLLREVTGMRERMRRQLLKPQKAIFDLKQDTGAMVDIEFLVQYLVLLKSHDFPALLRWTDNVRLIQTLIETGAMDEYTAHVLKHAYLIYRAAAHQLSLQEKPTTVPHDKFVRLRQRVKHIWKSYFDSA